MFQSILPLLGGILASNTVVPGGPGAAQRIQDAVDACPAAGCVIELPDTLYPLTNRIWIEGKSDLSLVGTGASRPVLTWDDSLVVADTAKIAAHFRLAPPTGGGRTRLPRGWLLWPYARTSGVGTFTDSSNVFSNTGYQHNGLVLVKDSKRVTLSHLTLDGKKAAAFRNIGVLDGQDLAFGSLGVSLLRSLAVDIRDCEIRHFWSAVYLNDRNPSCQAWTVHTTDIDAKPWTACGTMGGHLVERNRIHSNWFAVYSDQEWDQGSTFRENLAWNLGNQALMAPSEAICYTLPTPLRFEEFGGFLFAKDDLMPVHVFTHNTIYRAATPFAFDMYRLSGTALWSDNIFHTIDSLGSESIASGINSNALDATRGNVAHLWNSTILSDPRGTLRRATMTSGRIVDSSLLYPGRRIVPAETLSVLHNGRLVDSVVYDTVPTTLSCADGCSVSLEPPLDYQYFSSPLGGAASTWGQGYTPMPYRTLPTRGPDDQIHQEKVRDAAFVDSVSELGTDPQDTSFAVRQSNWMCRFCPFESLDPASPDFLVPDPSSRLVRASLLQRDTVGGHRGAVGSGGRLGSHVPVRVRARGMPRLSGSNLLLPVSIRSEVPGLDGLDVRRIRIAYRSQVDGSRNFLPETVVPADPSIVQSFIGLADSFITVALPKAKTGVVYQIDLWPVGISGADKVAATPVSWAWTSSANDGSFRIPTMARGPREVRLRVLGGSGGRSLLLQGYEQEDLILLDPRGKTRRLATTPAPGGRIARLEGMPAGIWFARLPQGPLKFLLAP